jgi:hypothetical protein
MHNYNDPYSSFDFSNTSIVYIEREYNPSLNIFFQTNIGNIQELFSKKGLEFIYIPQLISNWERNLDDFKSSLQYVCPSLNIKEVKGITKVTTAEFTASFLPGIEVLNEMETPDKVAQETIGAGLLRYIKYEYSTDKAIFNYSLLNGMNDGLLWDYLKTYTDDIYRELNPVISYEECLSPAVLPEFPSDDNFADASFEQEANKIATDIVNKINILKQKGYKDLLLRIIAQSINEIERGQLARLSSETKPTAISRLLITRDYRLILSDFNNLEVKMTPLPKAVFFLFLRHPKGILLKHLPEHRKELLTIYLQLSYKETVEEVQRSIHELVNPRSNSINEKCSRIKEAFIKVIDNSIAENYYVTGQRAKPKTIRIASSPDLITWEVDLKGQW